MQILHGLLGLLRRLGRFLSTETGEVFAGIFGKPSSSWAREEVFPGLFIRELEQRRVLSASGIALQEVGTTLVLGPGLQAGNGSPDTFEVIRQGAAIEYSGVGSIQTQLQGQQVTVEDSAPADTLTVTGSAASDDFTIASSHGPSLSFAGPPSGLTIQAGPDSTVDFAGITNLHGGNLTVSAGSIQVDGTLISHGGSIDLDAGAKGTLLVSGDIDVSDITNGHLGGSVELLGDRVGLIDQARIDASGNGGGGSVLVGGDNQGANPEIRDASFTYVGPQVHISADAITQGDGGHVVVWSNEATQFLGNISAQGGNLGGNGGSIETSGKNYLDVGSGSVTAAASHGQAGMWLLDPENVTIAGATSGGAFNGGNPNLFIPTADNATVDATTIETSLNAGTSVTITTGSTGTQNGDITVSASIIRGGVAPGTPTLVLQAAGNIFVNRTISGSTGEAVNVNLEAAGNVMINSPITTFGGSFNSSGIALDNTGSPGLPTRGTISTAGGNAAITQSGAVNLGSFVNTGTGSLLVTGSSISGSGPLTVGGGLTTDTSLAAGNQSLTVSGTVGVTKLNAGSGTITLNDGTFSLSADNAIDANSAVNISGATLDLNGHSITIGSLSGSAGTITDSNAIAGTSTLTVNQTATASFSGTLADGATRRLALIKSGSGALTLNSANTYTGGTTINAGTITLGNATALGSGSLALNGGLLDLNGNSISVASLSGSAGTITDNSAVIGMSTLTVSQPTTTSFSGIVADGAVRRLALIKTGSGTLVLNSANSYSGGTTIDAGTVQLGNVNALGAVAGGATVAAGATLDLNGQSVGNKAVTINGTGIAGGGALINSSTAAASLSGPVTLAGNSAIGGSGDLTLSGAIGGAFSLAKVGSGALTLSGPNAYSGGTYLDAGLITLGSSAALGTTGNITFAGGTLQFTAANTNDYSTRIKNSTSAISLDSNGQNVTLAGVLDSSNRGGLSKLGGGTLLLSGANTYTGATDINSGTLQLGDADALGSTLDAAVVASGAVLDLNGQYVGNKAVTINGTGIAGGGVLINSSATAASLSGPVTLTSNSSVGGSGDLALTGGIGGSFTLTLVGNGSLNASGPRLDSTVAAIVDNKSGGSVFISQGAAGVNLSGAMTNGSNLDLLDAGTTTLVGPLSAGSGSVTLSGAVVGGANLLTANSLALNGGGAVGSSGSPLYTNVNSLMLDKSGGAVFISQGPSGVNLSGTMTNGSNLDLLDAGTTTLVGPLSAGSGSVTLSGAVVGRANLLTANSLALDGGGTVGTSDSPLNINVNSLALDKSGGDSFLSQENATPLSLGGATGGNLTLNAGATTVTAPGLAAAGGALAVDSLVVNAPVDLGAGSLVANGAVQFNAAGSALAPTVKTGGNQTYYGAAQLQLDTALSAGGDITVYGTVDSASTPRSLTLTASGNITFNDNIGAGRELQDFVVTQANQVVFGGADAKGSNPQSSGPVSVIKTAGNIDIGQVSAVGGIVFDGGPGAANTLAIDATTGDLRLNGPVTLDSSLVVNTTGGNILFTQAATIDSRTGQNSELTLSVGSGSATFDANIGATQPLGKITVAQADGGVFFGGSGQTQPLTIDTAGQDITIGGPVTLSTSLVIGQQTTQAGTIDFESTIVSQGMEYNNLTIYAGTVDFHGNVGRLAPDPVGNPNPNYALGTATIIVSGAINIDPGVEIRVWHEDLGIPGGVSQIVTNLQLGPLPPQQPTQPTAATPSNPTQTIEGYFGLAPNYTEYGENFTIIVKWDEAFRTGTSIAPVITTYTFNPGLLDPGKSNLNAGGTLNLVVGTDGSINWNASSLNPGSGSGVVQFTITRTYSLSYLATVTNGLHASVTVVTDSALNFTIANQRFTSTTVDAPVTPVAESRESLQYTAAVAPPIQFQAYTPPAAQVVNSTQLPPANTLTVDQPVIETVKKVVRRFIIVKVDLDGNEGTPHALPDNTLENMPALLKRFVKSLPNGHYRIYMIEGVEGGPQTTRLLRDFYKSGRSLGDPVHEIGPGSIEGEEPEAPPGDTAPAHGGNSHSDDKTSDSPTTLPVLPGGVKSHALQGAALALGALGTAAMRRDWEQRIDMAMESGAGRSYHRAARALKQLQSKN
ncbi:MAG: beta strand repeat-containing protein [Thermoguttaceae bacterium]